MSRESNLSRRWNLRDVIVRRWFLIALCMVLFFTVLHLILSFVSSLRLQNTIARIEQKYGPLNTLRLAPPIVPHEQNRARLVRAAMELRVPDEAPLRGVSVLRIAEAQTVQEKIHLLRSVVSKNEFALNLLGEATKYPSSNWGIDYHNVLDSESPDLMGILRLAKLLEIKALVEIHDARPEAAVHAIRALIALGDSLSQERSIEIQVFRQNGLDTIMCALVQRLLTQATARGDVLADLQGTLSASSRVESMSASMVCTMAAYHEVYAGVETGGWLWSEVRDSPLSHAAVRWLLLPAVRDDHMYYLEHSERCVDAIRAVGVEPWSGSTDDGIRVPHWWMFLSKALLWETPARLEQRTRAGADRIVLATTAIALRRFKLDRGEYPDTLDALLPDYLEQLPRDAFTLNPPEYRRDGDGFVLWSAAGERSLDLHPTGYESMLRWVVPQ